MKRYYICAMIGDGQSPETAFRPAIHDIVDPQTGARAFSYVSMSSSNPDGTPTLPWCLVLAAGNDHTLVRNNADIDPLPDYPLDAKMSAMHTPTRTAALAKMQARGIDVSALSQSDGYRDVIRSLGRRHDAAFSEDAFDVAE